MSNDFNVPVPTDELDAKPDFLMAPGWYNATLQPGASLADNGAGWRGVRLPFSGFTSAKTGKTYDRDRRYQITIEAENPEAVRIGRAQLVAAASAFGLTEDVTDAAGKPAKRLTANTPEELVEQFNAVGGSPADVYVTAKKRKRGKEIVMRNDGTGPVMDNEITRVAPLGQGK